MAGQPLDEYREALQIGNSEKAAYLRQEITDTAAREALEAEIGPQLMTQVRAALPAPVEGEFREVEEDKGE